MFVLPFASPVLQDCPALHESFNRALYLLSLLSSSSIPRFDISLEFLSSSGSNSAQQELS